MKAIQRDDFYQYQYLSNVTYSPNKATAAVTVSSCNPTDNNYNSHIWIRNQNQFVQLTALEKESSFIFEDDKTILFAAIRDSEDKKKVENKEPYTAFYRISLDGGEAKKAFSVPLKVTSIQYAGNHRYVLVANCDATWGDFGAMDEKQREEVLKQKKENADYEVIDEVSFWSNGAGFTNKLRSRIYVLDRNNNTLKPITEALFDTQSCKVNPTKNQVLYTGEAYQVKPTNCADVFCYQLDSETTTCLYDKKQLRLRLADWMNDEILVVGAKTDRFGNNENPYFYTLQDQQLHQLAAYEDSFGSSVGSDCRYGGGASYRMSASGMLFITTKHKDSHIYQVGANGCILPILELDGSVDCFDQAENKILFVGMINQKLQEVYEYNLETKEICQLSHLNEEVLQDKYVATPHLVKVTSEGYEIEGWVLEPKDYDATKKYPAILDIHGGPKTAYGEVFSHEMQVWASEGYFVFYCNPIGSDGRENSFADLRGRYGTCDYQNIMDFTDEVLTCYPAIDSNRVGVTGGSYGGFMTNWIIGHTDRFKAAASQRSISNWISFYGVSDIGTTFGPDQQGADIYTSQDKLWWHSPLKYANQCVTPTLFIHSDEDYRCPMEQGLQMVTALMDRGIEARLCYFKGENHELSRSGKPLHRLRRLNEITDWMTSHLK